MKRLLPLYAAVVIPLTSPDGWQDLKFSKIKPNKNTFSAQGLQVEVDQSASPLIYPMKEPAMVSAFEAEVEIEGELKAKGGFPEDAYLRLGLVSPGARRLGSVEKVFAPEWIKRLFALVPKDSGVDKIYFFDLTGSEPGRSRVFPGSKDLMTEQIVTVREAGTKKIKFTHQLPAPIPTAALWLSIDGDDTKSTYKLNLKSLKLTAEPLKRPSPDKSE